jgi:hypothetical protein
MAILNAVLGGEAGCRCVDVSLGTGQHGAPFAQASTGSDRACSRLLWDP